MDLGLSGKRVLITGGSKGIGLACARAFAAEGCRLHLAARDPVRLQAARAALREVADVEVTLHAADLSRSDELKAVAAACGELDVLVNNAGAIPAGTLDAIDEARWRAAWDLKVFGTINLTRALLPSMLERRSGVIVNVIGLAGVKPSAEYICGAAGNAALIAFTRGLGAATTDRGVRVLGVNPTATRTDRIVTLNQTRARSRFGDESRWQELLTNLPFGRLAEPDEVASVVVYCASARASYLSGTVIDADGGALYR
jgi:NAD(P)-dependent dehydrogenase (short-subunit alcohol dehydrogenase family)